jgi:hypothetical protein
MATEYELPSIGAGPSNVGEHQVVRSIDDVQALGL